jgi:hypothetical protein
MASSLMRLLAPRYPDEVTRLVLVDAVDENRYMPEFMDAGRQQQRNKSIREYGLGYLLSPIAIPCMMRMHIGSKRAGPPAPR